MPLNTEIRSVRFGDCKRQDVNARFMRKEQYDTLVRNIRDDGRLTSVPLLYQPSPDHPLEIISGHHRIEAGTEAFGPDALFEAMVVLDAQSKQEIIARQISHNAIAGEDDLATLKQLYDQLEDVDWRTYSGLDDKTLELMEAVDLSSLAEANLDFTTVQISFLPHELEQAERAFEEARKMLTAQARWVAALKQYEPMLMALESARGAYSVGNIATALGIILDVFEAHIGDIREGWYDEREKVARTTKWIPVETLLGSRTIPADAGAIIAQAMDKAKRDADLDEDPPAWRLVELLAADYLAGS
jgi:hypothetical protein